MVGTIAIPKPQPFLTGPFEIQPSKNPDFECFWILNGRISDPHCTYVHGLFKVVVAHSCSNRFEIKQ